MRCSRKALWLSTLVGLAQLILPTSPGASAQPQGALESVAVVRDIQGQIGRPAGSPVSAETLARVTEQVSSKLRCPVCQGMSVADSPSTSARAMKTEISELLAQGYSESQVKNYFESRYGEFVLLDPKRKGLNWLVLLAPGAVFFGGLLWILAWIKRHNRVQSTEVEEDLEIYLEQVRERLQPVPQPGSSSKD